MDLWTRIWHSPADYAGADDIITKEGESGIEIIGTFIINTLVYYFLLFVSSLPRYQAHVERKAFLLDCIGDL